MQYIVKRGDTLADIAARFIGDAAAYPQLARANKLADPNKIYVGQVLEIPDSLVRLQVVGGEPVSVGVDSATMDTQQDIAPGAEAAASSATNAPNVVTLGPSPMFLGLPAQHWLYIGLGLVAAVVAWQVLKGAKQ